MDDSTLHALSRRLGTRAEQQTQERLERVARELTAQRAASKLAVFMSDGYLARYRGSGWGEKKTSKKRVEWHEIKTGLFCLQEQAARTESGRGMLNEKVVGWLLAQQNFATGNGGTGYGDSGGPAFWIQPDGTLVLVALMGHGDPKCLAMNFYWRVDLPETLDFIEWVIEGLEE